MDSFEELYDSLLHHLLVHAGYSSKGDYIYLELQEVQKHVESNTFNNEEGLAKTKN
ncbi:hypothetical protein KCTC52924_03433 [Arenibacter antarcticus]|uniref:Uncharacterized protein n=1 Tax=Arenibacter antarcticus TaxID=2040469 RepID=A0ABW5VGI1_9FLAO|nr:hypothetical protein [Arenibacter sp. H213]